VPQAPEISIVLPVYNEAAALMESLPAVRSALESIGRPFEIVCVDDGSADGTAALLDDAARNEPRLVPLHLTRRFGKEAALAAGLEAASGRAVILMDADLQHPPALLREMVRLWHEGYDVVEAVRQDRGDEGFLYRLMARIFYSLVGRSVGRPFQGSTDYKLLDRQVVDALLQCRERNRFFRGLVAWVGFKVAQVPFTASHRHGGDSKWSTLGLARYSITSLLAFTSLPLRIVAWGGLGMVLLGIVLAAQTFYNWFAGKAVSGFTTVILVELILGGLILVSLGVIAFYVALIYEEQKARPLFVVRRDPGAAPPQAPWPPRP
jgi:dolichol-phosphate mannosyltransferase